MFFDVLVLSHVNSLGWVGRTLQWIGLDWLNNFGFYLVRLWKNDPLSNFSSHYTNIDWRESHY